jgi:ferrous-iron efflux pump FieF
LHNLLWASPERAATAAAVAAGLLALSKITLYWHTGSLIVAVSAVDSSMDVVVSLLNRRALVFARTVPDEDHPYGHGKAESIAALGQGALLIGASLAVMAAAVEHLYREFSAPSPAGTASDPSWFSVLFFLAAGMTSVAITLWLRRGAALHNSPALRGDAEHYQSDVYTNVGSAVGLTATYLVGVPWLDPVIAAVFAGKITHSGVGLIRESVDELMDHNVGPELKNAVEEFARSVSPSIIDLHNFRGRRSGSRYLFDFHVTLPASLSFSDVHEIVELLEERIKDHFNADAVIHADPDCQNKQQITF